MYPLFEIRKVLSLYHPNGSKHVKVLLSSYIEDVSSSVLVLVCDNGYLLFRYVSDELEKPVIHQMCWFNCPKKRIRALSFDSSGKWLLTVTQDSTLYILPITSKKNTATKVPFGWKTDNLTEIKLTGQRGLTTSVRWWQTHEEEHIAILGSELGEISFINLVNKKEVGGTYITSGISALDILYDESHNITYLLITGNNQQQWRLLLEEKKSNFYWPYKQEGEESNVSKGIAIAERMTSQDEKTGDQIPHHLSKFESGTFLTPQYGDGRNLVSAYNSSSCILQVLEGDLDQMHLFSYKLPSECENIILSNKLIFTTSQDHTLNQHSLRIISRKFSEISSENLKKKEFQDAEVQKFVFDDEILDMYKLVVKCPKTASDKTSSNETAPLLSSKHHEKNHRRSHEQLSSKEDSEKNLTDFGVEVKLEGCLIVQRNCVWECKLRIAPESLFLSLTSSPSDLPSAERLGVMLGLDLHRLYDIAADAQLSRGQFAQAVHLYQLSKCPQLKRIAHFMGYGFLSELIAYIQVLFSTKGVEIVSADKCHFANIALHCFAHQMKMKSQDRHLINLAFKKFLKENSYYDEDVAAKLLSEQGLYELLDYFSKVRCQQGLMVEVLLISDGIKNTVNKAICDSLTNSSYKMILQHSMDEHYMNCMTSCHLFQFLAAKPSLLSVHLQHLITLLPKMDVPLLRKVAFLYDPSREMARLYFQNLAMSQESKRYWSISSSMTAIANGAHDDRQFQEEPPSSMEDIIKFFIFTLLMIDSKIDGPKFSKDFMETSFKGGLQISKPPPLRNVEDMDYSPVSCGQAHIAYIQSGKVFTWGKSGSGCLGTEEILAEYQLPQPVETFLRLKINVLAVSCGASHTLALTDYGLFSWGSSKFGQLGLADVQQTLQPRLVESLLHKRIVKIQCGQYHSMALSESGRLYTWGWGVHGQLGHGNAEDLNVPKVIESLQKKTIISIGAGQGHSVVLTKNGDVYTFGCGMFGQLGTGTSMKHTRPQAVVIPERIKLIASGFFHVLAVSRIDKIYMWGCNPQTLRLQAQNSRRARHHMSSNEQSSTSQGNHSVHRSPHPNVTYQQNHLYPALVNVALSDAILQVSCGSHHSVIVTSSGKLYSWGRNSEGQIGNGTRKEQKIPSVVSSLKERKVMYAACGADFTIAVDSSGKLFGWGQNDGGQVGQKPSIESNPKHSSSSSSGRVITIRTNRRMITITQPCRQSILRPVEIPIPLSDLRINSLLDSGNFGMDSSVLRLFHNNSINTTENIQLSKLDNPPYGPHALHAALEIFHNHCDTSTLLNYCVNFGNVQAAAKLCALEGIYDKALKYQLQAFDVFAVEETVLDLMLYIITFYADHLEPKNIDANKMFLGQIIKFWLQYNLDVPSLESFLQRNQNLFMYPLGLLLFSDSFPSLEPEESERFLNSLTTNFCMATMHSVLHEAEQGHHLLNLFEDMNILPDTSSVPKVLPASDALSEWDDSIPQDQLWLNILQNFENSISQSSIVLTSNDVDILTKSLIGEKFQSQSVNNVQKGVPSVNDAVVFSCGHHYTFAMFQSTVLPAFEESMQKLFYPVPQTTKLLLSEYRENTVTVGCPRCVVAEISNDL